MSGSTSAYRLSLYRFDQGEPMHWRAYARQAMALSCLKLQICGVKLGSLLTKTTCACGRGCIKIVPLSLDPPLPFLMTPCAAGPLPAALAAASATPAGSAAASVAACAADLSPAESASPAEWLVP